MIGAVSIISSALTVFFVSLNEHEIIYSDSVTENLAALTANTADDLLLVYADNNDPFLIKSALLRFDRYHHIKYSILYDANWHAFEQYIHPNYLETNPSHDLSEYLLPSQIDPKTLTLGVSILDKTAYSVSIIGEKDNISGYILVAHDYQQPIAQSRYELITLSLPLLAIIMLIGLTTILSTIKRLLDPLVRLSSFTREASKSKQYTMQFTITGSDEVATLAQDINGLLKQINQEIQSNVSKNTQLRRQRETMYQLANNDQLTGLPNRRYVMSWLQENIALSQQHSSNLAILYFDVDGFKGVNDRMGHDIGDKLLVRLGVLIKGMLNSGAVLARLAGDEFVIVLPKLTKKSDAVQVAEDIIHRVKEPIKIDHWSINTGVSIGIAFLDEAEYDLENLINFADIAMYHSKKQAKGSATLFNKDMLKKALRRSQISSSIAYALQHKEMFLQYQPKITAAGEIQGLEALIRWDSAELGFIMPSEFIPIAESCGMITHITEWVIKQVITDLDNLRASTQENVEISVNISSLDLKDQKLEKFIAQLIQQHPNITQHLQFELTESSYLYDFKAANSFCSFVKNMGATIALDDFGTGFSSLSYLTRIDIDTLKIDQHFIANAQNNARDKMVLDTILELSNNIGSATCCEGVESPEQAQYLIDRGCDVLQGFYFSESVPLGQVAHAVARAKKQYQKLDLG
ncbi:putative bifunctional diguanylate cyclase/phosphodiesterase [Marinomonas sp. IMCC 4694]|uniref:putative bifunctional diguanylate cyclase/phosphodiesterase n=1 Tax=Marinomonas sp. IMCC 4694 TaxID=2605432 RepID=UPI0011E85CB9|nr:EAL domain-containing protein [Marinomonas sp. IMCC 4694]TYL47582.1 EAL domain-containing protein [Marinomonas sp. IMCC 4694]